MHACPTCELEHVRIPNIRRGDDVFVPIEIVHTVEGFANPGKGSPLERPAYTLLLGWGLVSNSQTKGVDIIYLN